MDGPLLERLPPEGATDEAIFFAFLEYVEARGLTLYPAQEEAILSLYAGHNVILATPTGSGKSLVALALQFRAVARGDIAYYTSPIKALASEKFFEFARELSPEVVGMATGDGAVNREATVVCATQEILSNLALAEGKYANVQAAVIDEFHYFADPERGVAWQIPLLLLEHTQFLLMSATLGDTAAFALRLTKTTGRQTVVVTSAERPVPLHFAWRPKLLHDVVHELLNENKAPIYLVNFTQRAAAEEAQNLMSIDVCSKEEKKRIAEVLQGAAFDSPYGKEMSRYLRHGIGLHHAGLLPKYRLAVEKLAQLGLLKVISGTDTLGVGVNVPIRTVLFTKLCKYDGEKTALLKVRDFHQIAGRAGRKGFDVDGYVVALPPEHVVENLRIDAKIAGDPAKKKKLVKKKPPEKGYVPWDQAVFERLIASPPETLVSRFQVTHGMVLSVLTRPSGGCLELGRVVRRSLEPPGAKKRHAKTAQTLVRSLVDAHILAVNEERYPGEPRFRLADDLQLDFSLHHALSLFLVDTLVKIQEQSESYALDVLSLVEAIVEDPTTLLLRQKDRARGRRLAELKAEGMAFEERQAELEKVDYPQPQAEFLYSALNEFRTRHPWVGGDTVHPKGIAREMVVEHASFREYVREYGMERSEGLLLRYLSEVYKVLAQTVPREAKTEELEEIEMFFGATVREVDSSLLDEWERMRAGVVLPTRVQDLELRPEGTAQLALDPKALRILAQNRTFELLRALAYEQPLDELLGADDAKLATAFRDQARDQLGVIRVDPDARRKEHFRFDEVAGRVEQVLLEAEGPSDLSLHLQVDVDAWQRGEGLTLRWLTR